MNKLLKNLAGISLLSALGTASAAQVNFEITGYLDYVDPGNGFGLLMTDTITASGTFDDSVLLGGTGIVSFADPGNDMTITVGTATYTDAMELLGGGNLSLIGGAFDSLDYSATDGTFDSFFNSFVGADSLVGTWDSGSFSMSPVPVPAAIWLFGSGLLGLMGVARRKQ